MTQAKTTPVQVVRRNRRNAKRSTGPRSLAGKAVSRRNALKHGLTANPAAATTEKPAEFKALHDSLIERFQPRDAVEAGLVHRVAVCLWRLQRAARIDAAASNIAVNAKSPAAEQVQQWTTRITDAFWKVDYVEVHDKEARFMHGLIKTSSGKFHRLERSFLSYADTFMAEEVMRNGAAVQAVAGLIKHLIHRLQYERWITCIDAQLLAWLLGESAERLVPRDDSDNPRALYYPDERNFATRIDTLIGIARKRAENEPLPEDLIAIAQARVIALEAAARTAGDPYTRQQYADANAASLLPDAATLDRLIRYETHADRSLHRALETLAKLRGATVELVAARITGRGTDGSTVEVRGQRTQWTAGTGSET